MTECNLVPVLISSIDNPVDKNLDNGGNSCLSFKPLNSFSQPQVYKLHQTGLPPKIFVLYVKFTETCIFSFSRRFCIWLVILKLGSCYTLELIVHFRAYFYFNGKVKVLYYVNQI